MSKAIWGGKKITEIIKDAEQKKIKLNEFFTESQQVVGKINSAIAEVNKNLAEVSSQAEHAKNTVLNIDETQSSVQQIKGEVEDLKEATNKLIETNKALAEEIKNQLGIAAGASLSHTFNDRKSVLEGSIKKLFRWLIADIIILFFVALFVFLELKSNPALTPNFFLKFTLSFPFIYAAFFFHGQFNKEKQLLEEYAFKAAVSLSLEAYRQLLADEFDESEDKTKKVEFMTGVINKIYTSPRESIANHPDKEETIEIDILSKVFDMVKGVVK
ncbi:MAG: hypothetical protein AAB797_02510 [Patescibacteria group bacterium]